VRRPSPLIISATKLPTHTINQAAIDQFCDACWLEDGLSKNTLSAYRRDLTLLAQWLESQDNQTKRWDLYQVQEADLTAYMAAKRDDKAIVVSRSLSAFIAMLSATVWLNKTLV
jgi:integrase/recombinase XerD